MQEEEGETKELTSLKPVRGNAKRKGEDKRRSAALRGVREDRGEESLERVVLGGKDFGKDSEKAETILWA